MELKIAEKQKNVAKLEEELRVLMRNSKKNKKDKHSTSQCMESPQAADKSSYTCMLSGAIMSPTYYNENSKHYAKNIGTSSNDERKSENSGHSNWFNVVRKLF